MPKKNKCVRLSTNTYALVLYCDAETNHMTLGQHSLQLRKGSQSNFNKITNNLWIDFHSELLLLTRNNFIYKLQSIRFLKLFIVYFFT